MELFKNKYRIESARLKGFDYSSPGSYFVTINTYERICWFGDVIAGRMKLSSIGEIVEDEWLRTPAVRENVMLDAWQVMPDHVHGIIAICGLGFDHSSAELPFVDWEESFLGETTRRVVSPHNNQKQKTTLQPNSLGSILGQFKSKCTKRIHEAGFPDFRWQERFYDHIVRNEADLERIRQYIRSNPENWEGKTQGRKGGGR